MCTTANGEVMGRVHEPQHRNTALPQPSAACCAAVVLALLQVKLLLPSHAAMLPALSQTEWLKHKLVPLEFWITATDKRMCEMVALSVDDYSRWGRMG